MRVALIVPGGVDRSGTHRVIPVLLALGERLAAAVDLQVFALNQEAGPSRYTVRGFPVTNVGVPRTRLRALLAVLGEHRRRRFDVVHAFWAGATAQVAVAVGAVLRRPVLVHVAGGELARIPEIGYGPGTLWSRAAVRMALRRADLVTAASTPIRDQVEQVGVHAEPLVLGVDLREWPAVPPRRRVPGRPARLVHVGSLNLVKDQTTLLAAVARLSQDGVNVRLDVVGEDTLHGAVQRRAAGLGVTERVQFHGFLTQQALRDLMVGADLLVMSSRHEAGPVVLLEAAAAGVPTVGTAVGMIADWTPDAALSVPVADPAALAAGVRQLLDDDDRRLRLAAEAQRRAVAADADATAARVLEFYRRLTTRR
jgi:glycosyltransferase involved in cell wall biosynthesis